MIKNNGNNAFKENKKGNGDKLYVLKLYITGSSPCSVKALRNILKICKENFPNKYSLEVIDLYKNPHLAKNDDIIASPTLLKKFPLPEQKYVGDMTDTDSILIGFGITK